MYLVWGPYSSKDFGVLIGVPLFLGNYPNKARQAAGEALESPGEPWVRGGTPPNPIQRLELLLQVCSASQEIFQKKAVAELDVDRASWLQRFLNMCKIPADVEGASL